MPFVSCLYESLSRLTLCAVPEKPNTFALKSFHGYYMTISKDVRRPL